MDARVSDDVILTGNDHGNDDFLLAEGLEVLAAYRSIRNDAIRLAVKEMIAVMAGAVDDVP